MNKFSLAIHGGAGTILKSKMTPEKEAAYTSALQKALDIGHQILLKGGTALDAVEQAVRSLEDCHLFNAGKGSVYNSLGKHEMDASIMEGKNKNAGAVSTVKNVKNPITLARKVMEESEHVFLVGDGINDFAKLHGVVFADDDYFHDEFRYNQWLEIKDSEKFQLDHSVEDEKFGTVGAVALDIHGDIAAATSTGGMTNKKFGRIGDSSIIGAGTYANNKTCAVSCTGSGEFFIRNVVAYDVSCLMEFKGLSLAEASNEAINKRLLEINGDGGLIAVDALGNIAMPFNTEGMYRGSVSSEQESLVEIYGA